MKIRFGWLLVIGLSLSVLSGARHRISSFISRLACLLAVWQTKIASVRMHKTTGIDFWSSPCLIVTWSISAKTSRFIADWQLGIGAFRSNEAFISFSRVSSWSTCVDDTLKWEKVTLLIRFSNSPNLTRLLSHLHRVSTRLQVDCNDDFSWLRFTIESSNIPYLYKVRISNV